MFVLKFDRDLDNQAKREDSCRLLAVYFNLRTIARLLGRRHEWHD